METRNVEHQSLLHVDDLKKHGYTSLEEWLLANERHLYIGRNLAEFLGRPDLMEYIHTRKTPYIDEGLTKDIRCSKKLRLVKAIQESRFWSNPLNSRNAIDGSNEIPAAYKAFVKRTQRDRFAHLLEGVTFVCWCKSQNSCHGQYLLELAKKGRSERLARLYSRPYVYLQ